MSLIDRKEALKQAKEMMVDVPRDDLEDMMDGIPIVYS